MLKIPLFVLILFVSCYSLSACSSIAARSDNSITPAPYLGTKRATMKTIKSIDNFEYYGEFMIRAIDIPMSFLVDTILYPYDVN